MPIERRRASLIPREEMIIRGEIPHLDPMPPLFQGAAALRADADDIGHIVMLSTVRVAF